MASETQTQIPTKKRGGDKFGGLHIGMLVASTLLLTLAGVFLIMGMNILGIITMIAGITVRFIDTRI